MAMTGKPPPPYVDQMDLFEGVDLGQVEQWTPRAAPPKPKWSRYRGRERCMEGQRLTHAGHEKAHTGPARYRRVFGDSDVLMCTACAMHWREADGLTGLPG